MLIRRYIMTCLSLSLALPSCGDKLLDTAIISAAKGGSVGVTDKTSALYGSKAVFPGGAFSADTEVSIVEADSFIVPPYKAQGPAVRFTPNDLLLGSAARFTIPYDLSGLPSGLDVNDLVVFLEERPEVHFLGTDLALSGNTLTFSSRYMGTYQAGVVLAASPAVGESAQILFNEQGNNGYTLLDLPAGSELVVALSSFPMTVLTSPSVLTVGFTIDSSEGSASLGKLQSAAVPRPPLSEGARLRLAHDLAEGELRRLEERVRTKMLLDRGTAGPRAAKARGKLFDTLPSEGDPVTVKMLDVMESVAGDYVEIPSTVKKVGTHSIIVLDNVDLATVPQATIDEMSEIFDQVIYPRDAQVFGQPSDVDDNDRVAIFLTSKFDSTNYLGFFTAVDLLTNSGGETAPSNECDIMFTRIPTSEASKMVVFSTIAHEFQHLINFNWKSLRKVVPEHQTASVSQILSAPDEEAWLNEGYSHFAEDVTGLADALSGPP